jgi:hypothetical protein
MERCGKCGLDVAVGDACWISGVGLRWPICPKQIRRAREMEAGEVLAAICGLALFGVLSILAIKLALIILMF